uniref:Uncharacterized protein n=1 Tax=Oryza meridionalis TaxID=40149 RepID=A0A0E0DBQ3_9ORYZ
MVFCQHHLPNTPLGLVRLGCSRRGSGPNPRGSPRRGKYPGPCEIPGPPQGFPLLEAREKNHLLLGRGKFPREEAAAQRRRDGGGTALLERRRRRNEDATEGVARGARHDPEATAMVTATARLSPSAATFSPLGD